MTFIPPLNTHVPSHATAPVVADSSTTTSTFVEVLELFAALLQSGMHGGPRPQAVRVMEVPVTPAPPESEAASAPASEPDAVVNPKRPSAVVQTGDSLSAAIRTHEARDDGGTAAHPHAPRREGRAPMGVAPTAAVGSLPRVPNAASGPEEGQVANSADQFMLNRVDSERVDEPVATSERSTTNEPSKSRLLTTEMAVRTEDGSELTPRVPGSVEQRAPSTVAETSEPLASTPVEASGSSSSRPIMRERAAAGRTEEAPELLPVPRADQSPIVREGLVIEPSVVLPSSVGTLVEQRVAEASVPHRARVQTVATSEPDPVDTGAVLHPPRTSTRGSPVLVDPQRATPPAPRVSVPRRSELADARHATVPQPLPSTQGQHLRAAAANVRQPALPAAVPTQPIDGKADRIVPEAGVSLTGVSSTDDAGSETVARASTDSTDDQRSDSSGRRVSVELFAKSTSDRAGAVTPVAPATTSEAGSTMVRSNPDTGHVSSTVRADASAAADPQQPERTEWVTLRLEDGDSGIARVRVAVRGDLVSATISHQDQAAAHALRARLDELQQALVRQGLHPARLVVQSSAAQGTGSGLSGHGGSLDHGTQQHTDLGDRNQRTGGESDEWGGPRDQGHQSTDRRSRNGRER